MTQYSAPSSVTGGVLVRQQPGITTISWDKVIRFCHRTLGQTAARRSRTRQLEALSRHDERLLADIGLTREAQIVECSKLYWWWACDRDFSFDCLRRNYAQFLGRSR
jgi:uncharacterized protein YjiS (DUF1127 family)